MKEEYGLFVWPCSVILAEYVWQQRFRFRGSTILEVSKRLLLALDFDHSGSIEIEDKDCFCDYVLGFSLS